MTVNSRLEAVIEEIDSANADDPRRVDLNGRNIAFERLYSERMTERLEKTYPEASELLRIAARAQHLRRWEIARSDYPQGRRGYNDWRKQCRLHHARLAGEIMLRNGFDDAEIQHVGVLIRKEQLKKNPESQALENVAALVFLDHYFDGFLAKYAGYEDEKIVDILGKTLCKMSPRGHKAALELDMPVRARALVAAAIEKEAGALSRLAIVAVD